MIFFNNVTKIFENDVVGLQNVTIKIEKGEFVFFVGKNGSGKSTILKLITKEIEPTKGEIFVDDFGLENMSSKNISYYRRRLGIVNLSLGLLENKTVYDNIAFVMIATEQSSAQIKHIVPGILSTVGMKGKMYAFPSELSDGEKLRITLARALVNSPDILLADEPTASLDADTAWDIMCLLDDINRIGITVLVATHAREIVNIMKKRVVNLHEGKILGDVKKGKYGSLL